MNNISYSFYKSRLHLMVYITEIDTTKKIENEALKFFAVEVDNLFKDQKN